MKISREKIEEAAIGVADFVAQHSWPDMAEHRAELRLKVRKLQTYDVNEPTRFDCRAAARAAAIAFGLEIIDV